LRCGIDCKSLAPTWERLAADFANEPSIIIAKVNAEDNRAVAAKYDVKGYPTIKYFPKNNGTPLLYELGRDELAMVDYVNSQAGTYRTIGGGLTATAGTVAALDELIASVTGGDVSSVQEKIVEAAKDLKDAYAPYYVKVLNKLSENKGYVEKEVKRLEGMLKKGGLATSKIDDLVSRVNILKKFGLTSEKSEL
jgi:protein disulfide-isomerase A6